MKVLLLFPMADGQTGPAIKYAFEQLGHRVAFIDAKICPEESFRATCEFQPDLVFCSRTKELTSEVTKIKRLFGDSIIVCMWNVDSKIIFNEWSYLFALVSLCNYHFVVGWTVVSEWRRRFNKNTFWLPQGLQNEVYAKPKEITEEDREKYICDVCWTGARKGGEETYHATRGYHTKFRNPLLNAVERMGIDFKQWGCAGKPKIYNEEHNKMVALSKINLGCSGWPGSGRCVSVRDYKIMGAGGFLLERYGDGLEELFPCGNSDRVLDYYKDLQDLVNKIRYWLKHEEERKEIAERAYKWVHENATYTHRIKTALDYMKC